MSLTKEQHLIHIREILRELVQDLDDTEWQRSLTISNDDLLTLWELTSAIAHLWPEYKV
jgi:hypothetical protein